ncbi:MAG: enoyl-CoA hydratase/isomerase family protein [Alphaproteobacteria bacterium]|nr:enoyl-CoA hydratase/isomerase family protein [Alphaproteobacteria bacterium]
MPFSSIAVIGAGTMGSAIAGQIANAGLDVLLLDMPDDDAEEVNRRSVDAVERLKKSDPPALFSKSCAERIQTGNIRDDMAKLADADWIIEAVVERLDIKKTLYKQLAEVIPSDAVVTSNTSTIPIKVLVEDMDAEFRRRFAITHYFNPVRYMRLLELVEGEDTDPAIMARLKDMNDRVLGKGVVQCRDTPGFLGNRVGVYALQVGLAEAYAQGISLEHADAVMGRPMGIPKTGVFGLYDLIGVDLMSDVVATLATILPADDAFHAVGETQNPVAGIIASMLADGHKGDKSGGGFYRQERAQMLDLASGKLVNTGDHPSALIDKANAVMAAGDDALVLMISPPDDEADAPLVQFARRVLGKVFAYAASLIPSVTTTPQDIDDAMKLGFNWQKGPFEMMDVIGHDTVRAMIAEADMTPPPVLAAGNLDMFYQPKDGALLVASYDQSMQAPDMQAVNLPPRTIRFHMLRRCLTPLQRNKAASLYALEGDIRLVEFHSKANALTDESMEIVAAAAADHGRGIIIHNDAQHFSAGVDLTAVLALIRDQDWSGIDAFLTRFQDAVAAMRDAPVPVIAAPSGLAIGGGFEVIVHADEVIAHGNSVFGLVEAAVGVVPGGGGVKETMRRWLDATNDPAEAAWKTWMQIGYARTGTSPEESAKMQYFLPHRDHMEMNRDKLLASAMERIAAIHGKGYKQAAAPELTLPGAGLRQKMSEFMDKGIADGMFFPHDKTVAMAVASIVVSDTDAPETVSEKAMFARERRAFIGLAKSQETLERIAMLMEKGQSIRN